MKYWMTVQVQCEAEEILGKLCGRSERMDMLMRIQQRPGEGFARLGGIPVARQDMDKTRWASEAPGWEVVPISLGLTCFFCWEHAVEGKAKLEGG